MPCIWSRYEPHPLPSYKSTCFFAPQDSDLKGFGCLFPRGQGFHALGVLFNDCLFEGHSRGARSETWILGGAGQDDIVACDQEQILRRILEDRARLGSDFVRPLHFELTGWPRAIPHYTVEWEATLKAGLRAEPPLYLHGNYLGGLGLSKIYSASRALASRLRQASL